MDLTPYMPGLLALGGAIIGALGAIVVQRIVQGKESERALRRLAYESAMLHWKTLIDNKIISGKKAVSPHRFVELHLGLSYFIHEHFSFVGRQAISDAIDEFVARFSENTPETNLSPNKEGDNGDKAPNKKPRKSKKP